MSPRTTQAVPPANRLISALPKKEYLSLLPELTEVSLASGEVLFERGDTVRHVYFPNTSIISLLSNLAEQSRLQVGLVGNEGVVGISVFMGIDKASTRGLVQAGGSAIKMKSATMRRISNQPSSLHTLLHRYTYSRLTQISQLSACNRFHTVPARLARFLLMTSDRTDSNGLRLTQDFLAQLLGIRREAVNIAAGAFQKQRIINYTRGMISILNRAALEKSSCSCYAIIKESSNLLS